ncbi:hypothetical protein CDCA_CDCA20G4802 [Cyanidium caldarium]|uniref:Uncharacterized protein n=1 Tax=Cyanidium caldarium TaxID=2771 RepID=A0AAV9J2J9_CYACA|nr:hypothetical protein CDCA_CDCA20G4802 [Cyanidium caldarium]
MEAGPEDDSEVYCVEDDSDYRSDASAEDEDSLAPAVAVFRHHTAPVYALAMTADASSILSGGGDDRAVLLRRHGTDWSQTSVTAVGGFTDSVAAAVFCGAQRAAAASLNGELVLCDGPALSAAVAAAETAVVQPGAPGCVALPGIGDAVECLRASDSGRLLLCGAADGTAWLFDVERAEFAALLTGHQGCVHAVALSEEATRDDVVLFTAGADAQVRVWQYSLGGGGGDARLLHAIRGDFHRHSVLCMATHQHLLLSGDEGGIACLSNWRTGRCLARLSSAHQDAVQCVAIHARYLVSSGTDQTSHVYHLDGKYRLSLRHPAPVVHTAWCPDAPDWLAVATADGHVQIWDVRGGTGEVPLRSWRAHRDTIHAMEVRGRWLVTGGEDHTVRVFDWTSQA